MARVERAGDFSTTNNVQFIANITKEPEITALGLDAEGNFHRDEAIDINGDAIDTFEINGCLN